MKDFEIIAYFEDLEIEREYDLLSGSWPDCRSLSRQRLDALCNF